MKYFILLLLVAGVTAVENNCGKNAHYTNCGSPCPPTCDDLDNSSKICPAVCVKGCQCDKGFVRASGGRCVKSENCPKNRTEPECPPNKEFGSFGDCPPSCLKNPPPFCTLKLNYGCKCKKGYVLTKYKDYESDCIKPEECPDQSEEDCPANSHYEECGTVCPTTCDNYKSSPKPCPSYCISGCFCDDGYVQTEEGKCVKPERCAIEEDCPANSHYEDCGTACPTTCDNYKSSPKPCSFICIAGCFCDDGYVQNKEGKCVKPERCAVEEKNCVDKPDPGLCYGYFPMWYYAEDANDCKRFIYGGCQGNGNRYATKEQCLKKCATAVCGENERYNGCGTACPLTCDNYDNPPEICPASCKIGCECEKGFVRRADGKCVKPDQCPNRQDCDKAPETGPCRAFITRYYYDHEAGQCLRFYYGGCGGNRNNFKTENECYNKCGALQSFSREICNLEKVVGPCKAAFRRFFFNRKTGQCEQFIYGGCQGNENNFQTEEECENRCLV